MWLWGFIAFIIIIAIMFGITLHEAFWGIVGVGAALFGISWMFVTDSGKKFTLWAVVILGVGVGAFLCYNGITKKINNEQIYNNDIHSCENDQWRYESAKVYTDSSRRLYYYDQTKVNTIGDMCVQDAIKNKNMRNNWWLAETIIGITIVFYSLALPKIIQKNADN